MSRVTRAESSPDIFIVFASPGATRADATNALGQTPREKFQKTRSGAFDEYANDITFTVNGLDDARHARVVAQDLAQLADAHVDAAVERIRVAAARELDEP